MRCKPICGSNIKSSAVSLFGKQLRQMLLVSGARPRVWGFTNSIKNRQAYSCSPTVTIMSNENQQLVYNHTEQAELQRRAPRSAFWLGAAPYHPDIHRDHVTQDNEANSAPRGMFSHSDCVHPTE